MTTNQLPVPDPADGLLLRAVRRSWTGPLLVYLLALTTRLLFLHGAGDNPLYQFLILDERTQHEVAVAICDGTLPPNGYFKAPLYAYFLAAIYKALGADSLRARFVQIFVVSLSPVLVSLIGSRLYGRREGLIAGILAAVYWTFVFYSAELLDVSLACLIYLALAYLLVSVDDRHWWKWALAGGLLGLGAITRPNLLAFAPVLAVTTVLLARRRTRADGQHVTKPAWLRVGLLRAAILTGATLLAIAPITLRNVVVAHERLLISAYGGVNFFIANNPSSDGKNAICPQLDITVRHPGLDMQDPWVKWDTGWQAFYLYAAQHLGPRPRYDEVERFLIRATLHYIAENPGKFLADTVRRCCWLFNAYEYPSNKDLNRFRRFSPLLNTLSYIHFGVIGPLGILGLGITLRHLLKREAFCYYLAMILSLAIPGVVFVVNTRYRLPIAYLLMPMVAYGSLELVRMLVRPIPWRTVFVRATALAGLIAFSNTNWFGYRPPHHEYMLFGFAGTCAAAGRQDLMADAIEEIEQALADASYPHMLHPWAMTCLFDYYRGRGDLDKASFYGTKSLDRQEAVDPPVFVALVQVFCQTGHRHQAERALQELAAKSRATGAPLMAEALLTYGRRFASPEALSRAVALYTDILTANPADQVGARGLAQARAALDALQGQVTSKPPPPGA
ncbi:MAG: glycosyltransferase family 39 protein [Phycisphaerae bacterium]|nr:glycosyltransferase family 39 protein [Phycisphaerae bacterium]